MGPGRRRQPRRTLTGHTGAVIGGGVRPGRRRCWPPPATTGRCGCGTRPPGQTAAHPDRPHRRGVRGGVLARTARLLATAGGDGTVRLWDPATGQPARTLTGHTGAVIGGGVLPRRRPAGHRQRRRDGAAVGPGHRRRPRATLTGHTGWVRGGGVLPRRRACWPPPAATARCGCGTRPPAQPAAHPDRPHRPRCRGGGVLARTAHLLATAGTTGRCGCGTRPPAQPAAHPDRPHRRGARRWRSPRTGAAAGHRRRRRDGAAVGPGRPAQPAAPP